MEVRHNGNQPIEWYTDSLLRMRLYEERTQTINSFPVPQQGFLGISNIEAFNAGGNGAFSRLHLADSSSGVVSGYAPVNGFRGWMRNGVTFTGNADQGYVGQKYGILDRSDMVLQWSNDPGLGQFAPDYLRFIFTSSYDGTGTTLTGARSAEGLEAMRFLPVNDSTMNIGVGDFFAAMDDPTEHLDVLDGRVRIRQLPTEAEMDTTDQYVVVNDDGVLGWRSIATIPAATDCDWTVQNAATSGATVPHHVYTAVGSSTICPDDMDGVGVGTINPAAKLHVVRTPTAGDEMGIYVQTTGDANYSGTGAVVYGVRSAVQDGSGQSPDHIAFSGTATGGTNSNYGFYGSVSGGSNSFGHCGVRGESTGSGKGFGVYGSSSGAATINYGVYALGSNATTTYGLWARA